MRSSSYDFQAHLQRSQRRCCFSQTALLWFKMLPDLSPAFPVVLRLVATGPSYSEARQECPPMVWYSPEIDASKFTLHILSNTPGGFQCLKYILQIYGICWECLHHQLLNGLSECDFRNIEWLVWLIDTSNIYLISKCFSNQGKLHVLW